MIIPWHSAAQQSLARAHAENRLSHALLLHEDPGAGGARLALWAAQLALCAAATPPCGVCRNCRGVRAEQHPDLMLVGPAEDSRQIRIDDIRALSAELSLTAHRGGYKVAIIQPAEALNVLAANALLKTLEEPARRTLLLLVTTQPSRLPATIRSRCTRVRVRSPAPADTAVWLSEQGKTDYADALAVLGNAPFALLEADTHALTQLRSDTDRVLEAIAASQTDATATAERWSRTDYGLRLACIETWITDRIRRETTTLHLSLAASPVKIRMLFGLHDGVRELRSQIDTPLNKSVALERWLWRLAAACGAGIGQMNAAGGD